MNISILFSGDFHANDFCELSNVTKKTLLTKYWQNTFDEINYHIILGDGGFGRIGNEKKDNVNYQSLSRRHFPVLCVFGNKDPILNRIDEEGENIGIGEKVIVVRKKEPFIAYLKRGNSNL